MTTLENRPNTALLVVDVQNGVVGGAHGRDAVVANVGSLVERARREQVPVVWVQHSDDELVRDSDDWRIVPELAPDDAEPLVEKHYGDSFDDTTLETVLSELGVGRPARTGSPPRPPAGGSGSPPRPWASTSPVRPRPSTSPTSIAPAEVGNRNGLADLTSSEQGLSSGAAVAGPARASRSSRLGGRRRRQAAPH
jgi:Isochorismatase family